MYASRIALSALLAASLLLAGCVCAESTVRQKDGTYKTTHHLIWKPDLSDPWSFKCTEDHMVATVLDGVTYGWPVGSGSHTGLDSLQFEGKGLKCEVAARTLTVNGLAFEAFVEGDHVLIMPDGRVLVNDIERFPIDAN